MLKVGSGTGILCQLAAGAKAVWMGYWLQLWYCWLGWCGFGYALLLR